MNKTKHIHLERIEFIMLTLFRKGNKVFYNNQELTIVEQKTKGEGREVVKIAGLDGSNGQKWISLSKLVEGKNELTGLKKVERTINVYTLTKEEKEEVDKLQKQIDDIVELAKTRHKLSKPRRLEDMTIEELEEYINSRKGN